MKLLNLVWVLATAPSVWAAQEVHENICVRECVLAMDETRFCEIANSGGSVDTLIFFTANNGEDIELSDRPYQKVEEVLKDLPDVAKQALRRQPDLLDCGKGSVRHMTSQPPLGRQL